jgi:hypothetical protein
MVMSHKWGNSMREKFLQSLIAVVLSGALAGSVLAAVTEAPAPQVQTAPLSAVPQISQPKKLRPEQEAALVEVRKILREASEAAASVVVPRDKNAKFIQNNKNVVLRDVITAQARAGDIEGAQLTLKANQWKRSWAIGIAQAKAGVPDDALKNMTLESLDTPERFVLVKAMLRTGDVKRAREIAEAPGSLLTRVPAIAYVASLQAKQGDLDASETFQRALQAVQGFGKLDKQSGFHPYIGKYKALVHIARYQAEVGDMGGSQQTFLKAREAALAIPASSDQLNALLIIASIQVQTGDRNGGAQTFSDAIRIARRLTPDQQLSELGRIAHAQLEMGSRADAEQTMKLILSIPAGKSPRERVWGLMGHASWELELGDRDAARTSLKKVLSDIKAIAQSKETTEFDRDYIYDDLASLLAKTGDLEAAQEAHSGIGKSDRTVGAIRKVVETLSRNASSMEAVGTIQRLANVAKEVVEGFLASPNDVTLKNAAITRALAGDVKGALKTADRVPEGTRQYVYTEMIDALVSKKDWAGAHHIAASIKESWLAYEHVCFSLKNVFKVETKEGEGEQGLQLAHQQAIQLAKVYALLGVAEGAMDSAWIEPLLPTIRP